MADRRASARAALRQWGPVGFLWLGLLLVTVWARVESAWVLAAAGVAGPASLLAARRSGRQWVAVVLLVAAVGVGLHATARDRSLARDWTAHWDGRRALATERVRSEFEAVVARGDALALRLARVAAGPNGIAAPRDSLRRLLEDAPVAAAAAIHDADGRLARWHGSHRGRFPRAMRSGERRYGYFGTPLFSYLYFARPVPGNRGVAVVAFLARADLPEDVASGMGDLASRLAAATGERVRLTPAGDARGVVAVDYRWPDEPLLEVAIAQPDPETRRADAMARSAGAALALAGLAWLTLAFGRFGPVRFPVVVLVVAAALIPLDALRFPAYLSATSAFELAGLSLPLGRVLLLAGASLPLAALASLRWRPVAPRWAAPTVVAAGFPLALLWTTSSASPDLLGALEARWIALLVATTIALTAGVGFALACRSPIPARKTGASALAGLATAVVLCVGVAVWVRTGPGAAPAFAALWALPAAWVARGLQAMDARPVLRWFSAFFLAATCTLPFMWSARTVARMEIAEARIGQLGIAPNPELDALLDRFAARVDSLDREGASGVETMYRAWVSSGLAGHGSPAFVTLWSADGAATRELRLGTRGDRPAAVARLLPELQRAGRRASLELGEVDVHRLVAVPLAGGRMVTGAVPPRRAVAAPGALAPLFAAVGAGSDEEFLTLVRAPESAVAPTDGAVVWTRNAEGWHAEAVAPFPDGPHRVSYTISIPKASVMLARGALVLLLTLAAFSALWLVSVAVLDLRLPRAADWWALLASFRARVTWTLFGFFVLSNVVFGTLAYRALGGASERAATALAERAVNQAAEAHRESAGSTASLARRVGADLLEYRGGELVGGSAGELVDLGLYEGWVDPEIHAALEGRERLWASKTVALGAWRSVVAHRRLADGAIVASTVPLRSGAAALRRRDVADLLALAIVLGPILAFGLALVVGGALTRPIDALRVASRRVGAGNLAVHLPGDRKDEFGSVFVTFNEMVRRLDSARRDALRTARRTEAIVAEAATGVVAMDSERRVTVANRRAEWMLSSPLEVGSALPTTGPHAAELASWLEEYERAGAGEADADFAWSGRRIRGRARRIEEEGRIDGIVVSLQDVTDELERERILVLGDMAQRIAHEIKNPLTPVKLSVQHLQRVWRDRPSDFDRALRRGAGVILAEIDRLASIARRFSRMGSLGAADSGPLDVVDVGGVVRELADLYTSDAGAVFRLEADAAANGLRAVCRRDELKGVLINLLENARNAMAEGGTARISVRETGSAEESWVAISVEDEGVGVPERLLARVFEPRFSTRSSGTGLGLWIAKRSVESWGGAIEMTSEVGRGTAVEVRLPSARARTDSKGSS